MSPGRNIILALLPTLLACAGTRPADIGIVGGALIQCPRSPNCVSSQAPDPAHHVAPLELSAPPERAWSAAREAVLGLPATQIVRESEGYLHAESTSALMGYVDDLELHLDAEGARIDVRSASRVGYGDGGVNRARVETLRAALAKAGVVIGRTDP